MNLRFLIGPPMAAAVGLLLLAPLLAQDEAPADNAENGFRHRNKSSHMDKGDSSQPQAGFRGGQEGGGRRFPTLEMLADKIPAEDLEELRRLQREDPQAFRRKFHELMRRFRQERSEGPKKVVKDLQQAYRDAPDDAARDVIREQIAATVKAEFEEQMKSAQQHLAQSRTRLAEIEKKFVDQQAIAEQIIADRIRALTSKPSRKLTPAAPQD